ncbi:amidohydrolase [Marinilabiliaceae bacterium N1Y90]|nr:amidohydrolase [Marinilabiliaceae bacterium N1Y90]
MITFVLELRTMVRVLKTAVVQQDIIWENATENLGRLEKIIGDFKQDLDLLVLPEMFHCGFTMQPTNVVQKPGGAVVSWMHKMAKILNACVMGSIVEQVEQQFVNRLYVIDPNGEESIYDKRHLFRMGGENKAYKSGDERLIVNINGWRICPLICYDLRFPVWSRNRNDYDVLIYVANWPSTRRDVWRSLLKARALENQSYVIGANRVGEDGSNNYAGDSMMIDAKGKVLVEASEFVEEVIYSELSYNDLHQFREKFPVWMDSDDFEIKI